MMLYSMIRFWYKGWIDTIYINPNFHFKYYGFEWVKGLGEYTYLLFIVCIVSSVFIIIGLCYRASIVIFFLTFTYIELIEKTTYLNHYYFVSLLSFLLIFLPANSCFSFDNILSRKSYKKIPKWTVDSIKLLMIIIYFYAGIAKINSDWLFNALPLKIWLPSKYDIPLIGETILQYNWVHYLMSWGGMFYDLLIPFLLLIKRTRLIGFMLVVFFHIFTAILFPIGMFPYIMIVSALIFFDGDLHDRIITFITNLFKIFFDKKSKYFNIDQISYLSIKRTKTISLVLIFFFIFQIITPFRYLLYPSELFWSEEGYRFSWRVMLVEKIGYTNFKVVDKKSGETFYVKNSDFLTLLQIKQMSFQSDMILEFAHYIGNFYRDQGYQNIAVYAESYVSLNGRSSEKFIDSEVDLLTQKESFRSKKWIKPFKDDIKGF